MLTYNPDIFRAPDLDAAKRIILTAEGSTTEERWKTETPLLTEMIVRELSLQTGQLILDYGCGIGRLSRELCLRGCRVIGVDISPEMRMLSCQYVNHPGAFLALSPEEFDLLTAHGLQVDGAIAIWVLQHCLKPADDLARIAGACRPGAGFFVCNNRASRAVPVREKMFWYDDAIDIWAEIDRFFTKRSDMEFPEGTGVDPRFFQCCGYVKKSSSIITVKGII